MVRRSTRLPTFPQRDTRRRWTQCLMFLPQGFSSRRRFPLTWLYTNLYKFSRKTTFLNKVSLSKIGFAVYLLACLALIYFILLSERRHYHSFLIFTPSSDAILIDTDSQHWEIQVKTWLFTLKGGENWIWILEGLEKIGLGSSLSHL